MIRSRSIVLSAVVSALGLGLLVAAPARAAFVVTVSQVGSNVVLSGTGSLNTGSFTDQGTEGNLSESFVAPFNVGQFGQYYSTYSEIVVGGTSPTWDLFTTTLTNGPANGFGPASSGGLVTAADTDSGDPFEFLVSTNFSANNFVAYPNAGKFYLPTGYNSGAPLSDSATFDNTTIAALGITPGTYTYDFGSGSTADTFTITTASAVPEPTSLGLLGLGATALLGRRRRVAM